MRRALFPAAVAVVGLSIGIGWYGRGAVAGGTPVSVWRTKYTPTKIEWLVLHLNAIDRKACDELKDVGYCVGGMFMVSPSGDGVRLVMETSGPVPLSTYDEQERHYRKMIELSAEEIAGRPVPIEVVRME